MDRIYFFAHMKQTCLRKRFLKNKSQANKTTTKVNFVYLFNMKNNARLL